MHLWIRTLTPKHSISGEPPPPPPRACFGRDGLIERIIGLVEGLTPVALIGAGGIGKTSVSLTVLHDNRIKKRFGENRRFIRCDKFPAAQANFLSRLSQAVGAGVENPKDLAPLRTFLSSQEMFIVLDNAESILDPRGADAQEIYAVVEELSQLSNICLCITSRITTIPSDCKRLDVPTLSMDAARGAFYRIYDNDEKSEVIDNILEQLDFHPLSVTLLATVAHQNNWDNSRLGREWEQHRTSVLKTEHNTSLAATIELSLASLMFRELGPTARELLGIIAFFPQGIDEDNTDWLFPTIPDRRNIVDKFCILSLTSRSNGFITMLAPIRDHLSPRDPRTSPLLCTTKDRYSARLRLLGDLEPDLPGFGESRWITLEDVNVEHLLNVFTSFDIDSHNIWATCADFVNHLHWHKPRSTVLWQKMEGLSDDHPSKPECLFQLSRLFASLGNRAEEKRVLTRTLELERGQGDDGRLARTLRSLIIANRMLGLYEEGRQQSREALDIYERLGDAEGQGRCWNSLGWLLLDNAQLDAAEEAASRAIKLLLDQGRKYWVCESHRLLGNVYQSKGDRGKAIQHFGEALTIASFDWHFQLLWVHYSLAYLFCRESKFDEAQPYIEQAKSHAINDKYRLGRVMHLQALTWYLQGRLEEAKAEVLCALETYEKVGVAEGSGECRDLLKEIELAAQRSDDSRPSGESSVHDDPPYTR